MSCHLTGHMSVGVTVKIASNGFWLYFIELANRNLGTFVIHYSLLALVGITRI